MRHAGKTKYGIIIKVIEITVTTLRERMNSMSSDYINDLLTFIQHSPSPYHTVRTSRSLLDKAGFSALSPAEDWHLQARHAYYVPLYGSGLVAFRTGSDLRRRLRLCAAHTDFPCLRLKYRPEIRQNGYLKLNAEVYGGLLRESWLDRPLSLAGTVAVQSDDVFRPDVRLIDVGRPLVTIPRLAIHMNRKANQGVELNPQKDLLPVLGLDNKELTPHFFLDFLSEICRCLPEAILSYDLTVYPTEAGCRLGWHNEFVSSPRLDNLTSVLACLTGLVEAPDADGLSVTALFDNEEVGSQTKQGADSQVLPEILRRIYHAFSLSDDAFSADLARAFMLSVDVAHAIHPNVPEKCDLTNQPVMGRGVALKIASSQRYAGDAAAVAVVKGLCREKEIPYQIFMNRSDIPGGSTLGSLLSANLPLRAMDIGIPITAMHSCRELMGAADQQYLTDLIRTFFNYK